MTGRSDIQLSLDARIAEEAMRWLGTPYRHQGTRRGVGCDCLGLVRGVWRAVYGEEAERPTAYSPDWAETSGLDPLLAAARRHCVETNARDRSRGRLVIFRWKAASAAKHAGIMTSPTHFIHAYQGHGVVVSPLVPQWRSRIAGIFRFPPTDRDW